METPQEYKVIALRDCPIPEQMALCDTPERAAEYWTLHIKSHASHNPEVECLIAVTLNTRRRITGHYVITWGTNDTCLVHPREVFRTALTASAAAIILIHNHPSGESTPSEADIRVTRDLMRAGQLLKVELLDHVIIGNGNRASLRELGYLTA